MNLSELPNHLAKDWPGSTWFIENFMTLAQFPHAPCYVPSGMVKATPELITECGLDGTKPWANPYLGATHLIFDKLRLPPLWLLKERRMITIEARSDYNVGLWLEMKAVHPPTLEEMIPHLPEAYWIELEKQMKEREARRATA